MRIVTDERKEFCCIYPVKSAEAIYERGTLPVGPALFCSTETVKAGEGRSRESQQRFASNAGTVEST